NTATWTPSPTRTPTTTSSPTAASCVPVQPSGWVVYFVKSGDTLSGLAAATASTMSELINVNCITNPRLLVTGEQLYLPTMPETSDPGSSGGDNNGGDDNGEDDNGDDDNDDDNGDDD
ncbi:MAG: LysM peptidoglycan-binding domain-containing protein, partial [Anaerolineae bacterium]|nr:LysM peptidoglycan-binding domain-containing protein [Anaerolineae bacterium]